MFKNIKAFAFDVDGVFTDGSVLALPNGDLLRTFNAKDCFAVRTAADNGYTVAIITGGCSESLIHRAKSLGIKKENLYMLSKNKIEDFDHFCKSNGLKREEVAFVGDDLPDIPVIKAAGLGVCPADAASDVKEVADYISPYPGGRLCIRDLVEKVLRPAGNWKFNPEIPWTGSHPDDIIKFASETGKNA